jgi:hypothetical protein
VFKHGAIFWWILRTQPPCKPRGVVCSLLFVFELFNALLSDMIPLLVIINWGPPDFLTSAVLPLTLFASRRFNGSRVVCRPSVFLCLTQYSVCGVVFFIYLYQPGRGDNAWDGNREPTMGVFTIVFGHGDWHGTVLMVGVTAHDFYSICFISVGSMDFIR